MKRLVLIMLMALASVAAEAAMSAADSIRALVNLFDLTLAEDPYRADSIAEMAYHRALSAGDTLMASSMLAARADINANSRDSLNMLLMRAECLSACRSAEENILFIRLNINSWYRDNALESERLRRFAEQSRRYMLDPPADLNERIVLLHSVCVSMPFYLNSSTLYDHFSDLAALIDRKPEQYFKLKVLLCRCEAFGYLQIGDIDRAMGADLRMLSLMDSIETSVHRLGRNYFQLNFSRFRVYTRLLSNFEHLTPVQVRQYYQLAHLYLSKSSRARREFAVLPIADIFYYLSIKDYAHAAPLLDTALEYPELSKPRRLKLLRNRVICAEALGQDSILHATGRQYLRMLESMLQQNMSDSDRGRRAVYEAFVARYDLSRFEAQQREQQAGRQRVINVSIILIMTIMFVVLLFFWHQKMRSRRLAKQLMQANRTLQIEVETKNAAIERLTTDVDAARASAEVKSDFIRHLAEELAPPFNAIGEHSRLVVDCCHDHPNREYLAEYLASIESNSAVITALLNDMQRINSLEDGSAIPQHRPVDVSYLLSLVVDSVTASGATIPVHLTLPPERLQILSDEVRLRQIFTTTLQCLVQLTPESVAITAHRVTDGKHTVVAFAATSDKLVNYNLFAGPTRLDGMLYTRLLTHLVGGDLLTDTTYAAGLRLLITLPQA